LNSSKVAWEINQKCGGKRGGEETIAGNGLEEDCSKHERKVGKGQGGNSLLRKIQAWDLEFRENLNGKLRVGKERKKGKPVRAGSKIHLPIPKKGTEGVRRPRLSITGG